MGGNETLVTMGKRLGRLPSKRTRRALQFADFFRYFDVPPLTSFWSRYTPLPLRTYGNTICGNCTRAKQAVAATRMEWIEQGRLIEISDDEVIRVYQEMSIRRYNGGDDGAYEDDALNDWRNPETTFRDVGGNPYTIDAYLRINASNEDEIRAALALSRAHGIAVCFNLPAAWQAVEPPGVWDVPHGQPLIGEWMPGSWGGHSMWAHEYTEVGPVVDQTWDLPPTQVTWEACAAYMDEAHLVIDSLDAWRDRANVRTRRMINDVRDAVNAVSSIQV
jgi:hypothetical protein